ncbi:hypothetical protein [Actinoplanes sp. ATCC 53533]|uniref:hypothetical protein n=1 Tax=Actinoplanes sp. ATCC 53533 TaxID=1288362 RepID=UPI0018F34B98|nr:hypothetical protein [Actinoplanes sp. ATCC 53533]
MPEQVLQRLEVGAGRVGERRGAVAEIVQPHRREFLRLWHTPTVSADEAQRMVQDLVARRAPVIEDFDGFLKVLDSSLSHGEHLLVLLYHCGSVGATREQLREWATPAMRKNMGRIYTRLERELNYIHRDPDRVRITRRGIEYVDQSGIVLR